MRVVGIQLDIVWEDKEVNFAKVRDMLVTSAVAPGSIIVLPEMFATGYSMNVEGIHEAPDGPTECFLKNTALQYASYVLGGVVTKNQDGLGLNQALLITPQGELAARYSKLHPFSYAGETHYYAAGERFETLPIDDLNVTPFICYDLRFPEVFRHAVQRGVNCFIVIACWPQTRQEHWLTLLKARAIENVSYVVGINRCGQDPTLAYSGRSQIISPTGEVLLDAHTEELAFTYDLDLAPLQEIREHFPVLQDIRPEYRC